MLVNAKEMLQKALKGHYAIAHININNLEWTKAALLAAEEVKSPIILGVSEGAGKYMGGYKTIQSMVSNLIDFLNITVPVATHLDHGSYDGCLGCIDAKFTSIMFDGSKYPIEENVKKTKELVELAHSKGMSIEAEVGAIGGEEDGVKNQQYEVVDHEGDYPRCHCIPAHYGIDNTEEHQYQKHTEAGTCRMERGEEVKMLCGNPLPEHRQGN